MVNRTRIYGVIGMILVLGLSFVSCVSSNQYLKENQSLKNEINQLQTQNANLMQDIAILQTHNEKLMQQAKETQPVPTPEPMSMDTTPLVSTLKQSGLEVTIRDGCPAVIVSDIFEPGETTLSSKDKQRIKKIASIIHKELSPVCGLMVDGYTDNEPVSKGKKYKNNKELSAARAKSVAHYLVKECGFSESSVQSKGLGETNPIASNKTKEGREKNRRVELVILVK